MTPMHEGPNTAAWAVVERERLVDAWVRRVCGVAWVVTLLLATGYTITIGTQTYQAWRLMRVGALSGTTVLEMLTPALIAMGVLTLLVATLSTVAVFLRFRTASLSEIQLRLASLESMLAGAGHARGDMP